MRIRNKPHAAAYLKNCDFVIEKPEKFKGLWSEKTNKEAIKLELGSGKGDYVVAMANKYPNFTWIAIEKNTNVAYITAKKIKQNKLENIILINDDVEKIDSWFDDNEVQEIYLNFSDPWHKRRHHKRRLTNDRLLKQYSRILIKEGLVIQKTDNRDLFEYSISNFSYNDFYIDRLWLDFRSQPQEDPITEYEQRFMDDNQPIYRAIYRNKKD